MTYIGSNFVFESRSLTDTQRKFALHGSFRAVLLCAVSIFIAQQFGFGQQFVAPTHLRLSNTSFSESDFIDGVLGVSDFNGDGRKDMLVLYQNPTGAPEFAVLFSNSDGSFTPKLLGIKVPTDPTYGNGDATVKVADVNGDGRSDLVIVFNYPDCCHGPSGPSSLAVYLGNGDGTFRGLTPTQVTSVARLDLVADLNNDGKPDLIIDDVQYGTGDSRHFTVWTNDGAGVFKAAFTLPDPNFASYHGLNTHGDFNHDGYIDVVLQTDNGLQVFLNDHGTRFVPGQTLTGFLPLVAAADLNHDGKQDLVGFAQVSPTVYGGRIMLGNGDGTFRIGSTFNLFSTFNFSLNTQALSLYIADFTEDGNPDIGVIVSGGMFDDGFDFEIFPGLGNGTFGSPSIFNLGSTQALFADLNRDGRLDLVLSDIFNPLNGYALAANTGKGTFHAPRQTALSRANSIVSADFNKDGKGDIAVVADSPTTTGHASVVVYPGIGSGNLGPARSYSIPMPSGLIAAGDVNGDGKLDLVVARSAAYISANGTSSNSTDLSVLLGNGDGSFRSALNYTVLGTPASGNSDSFVALGDVNHDGRLDLIGDWGVALGKGNGTFGAPTPLLAGLHNVVAMAAGDFNRDGVLDLAVGTSANGIPSVLYTMIGNGHGSYAVSGHQQLANTFFIPEIAIGDMNGDGRLDLVFDSYQASGSITSRNLTVRLGNGNGTFSAPVNYPLNFNSPGSGNKPLLIGDFNRDGKADVLILGGTTQPGKNIGGNLVLLLGIGGGKLSSLPQYYSTHLQHGVVLDLNGDGALDIAGTTLNGVTRVMNTGSKATVTK